MKLFCLVIVCSCLVFMSACDEISTYEKTGGPTNVDTSGYAQKVLLEEFTGHTCRNCPAGHRIAAQLRGIYGSQLITMAVHAGGFAEPEKSYPLDFQTASGTALNDLFNVNSYPAGVVNRTRVSGQFVESSSAWGSTIAGLAATKSKFKLSLSPSYSVANEELTLGVTVQTQTVYTSTKPINIALYIVEDSIIAPQLDLNTRVVDYVHRDVLRDAPLGTYGSELTGLNSIPAKANIQKSFKYSFSGKTWKVSHCKVIAVLTLQEPDYTILQVEEVHVIE